MAIIDVHAEIGTSHIWGIPFTDANIARSMQKYGVDFSVVSSTVANSVDFHKGNSQIAGFTKTNPALKGCIVVNLNYPELSYKEMHSYLNYDNFSGILLSSGTVGKHVNLAEAEEILNGYRRFVKPVFIKVTDADAVLAANEIAREFTGMKFVLLGMGGNDWRIATVVAEKTLNLVLDVSGSFSPDKIKFAVERIGSHRMVYGSGLPYTDPACIIAMVQDADITDGDKRNIFENCARRMFGLRKQ